MNFNLEFGSMLCSIIQTLCQAQIAHCWYWAICDTPRGTVS